MAEVPDDAPLALWHATPLAHLPTLLDAGRLLSRQRLAAAPNPVPLRSRPRGRSRPADRVHLSPTPRTPLLADRLRDGIPCALLHFSPAVADLPGAALARRNGRAWAHRDDFAPVTDPDERAALWRLWRAGRLRSLEVVVPDALDLDPHLKGIALADPEHARWIETLCDALRIPCPGAAVDPSVFPDLPVPPLADLDGYARLCRALGRLLPPPDPFLLSDGARDAPGSVDTAGRNG